MNKILAESFMNLEGNVDGKPVPEQYLSAEQKNFRQVGEAFYGLGTGYQMELVHVMVNDFKERVAAGNVKDSDVFLAKNMATEMKTLAATIEEISQQLNAPQQSGDNGEIER